MFGSFIKILIKSYNIYNDTEKYIYKKCYYIKTI